MSTLTRRILSSHVKDLSIFGKVQLYLSFLLNLKYNAAQPPHQGLL